MADFLTVKVNNHELQSGAQELAALRTSLSAAERGRDKERRSADDLLAISRDLIADRDSLRAKLGELEALAEKYRLEMIRCGKGWEVAESALTAAESRGREAGLREAAQVVKDEAKHSAPCWCKEAEDGMDGETCDCCHFVSNVEDAILSRIPK